MFFNPIDELLNFFILFVCEYFLLPFGLNLLFNFLSPPFLVFSVLGRNWIIIVDHIHNIVEIGHVFGKLEREVIMMELFIVNDALNLIADPSVTFDINDLVLDANVHCNGHLRNGRDVDKRWFCLPIFLKVFLMIMIVELYESVGVEDLTVMRETLYTCTMRKVPLKYLRLIWAVN